MGEEADQFFDEHIKEMMPGAEGEDDDDPDMDDDSAFDDPDLDDDEDDGGEEEFGSAGSGDDASADGEDDDLSDDDDSDGDAPSDTGRKGKRKASEAGLSRDKKVKALKKKHAGSMF